MNTFKLRHQCGKVYYQGNLEYSQDGNSLLTIIGNRVSIHNLANQTSRTIRAQGRSDISLIALSPDQQVLFQVDVDGYAQIVLLKNDTILSYLNFHAPVTQVKFSPDGKYLAVALGSKLRIFECAFYNKKYLGTLLPHLSFSSWHSDSINHFQFWKDYLITSSSDQSVRFCNLTKPKGYIPITLTGHRKPVLGSFLCEDILYTISSDARVFVWTWQEATEKFLKIQEADYQRRNKKKPKIHSNTEQLILIQKHQLQHEGVFTLSCVSMIGHMLVVGFKTGNFALYSVNEKEVTVIHTLNMSDFEINAISINNTGEWLAFASKTLGQLLVWEWKSESYILRQMGHSSQIITASFSPDGNIIATGGIDGKVKLWEKGLCFATFSEHTNGVVDLAFSKTNAVLSASKDGTVRAYDIARYKQFRVMTTNTPVEFSCMALDNSGEFVCAGAIDYQIYIWALQTGILCDVLSGHTAPVSCVAFSALNLLISGSWDKSVRIWDIFEGKGECEVIDHHSEVHALCIRGDGKEIGIAGNNGELYFWKLPEAEDHGFIEGKHDIAGGRGKFDRFTAKNNANNKNFNSIAYSPDGNLLLAAGNSKYSCIYDLRHKVLLHRFSYTENRSLSGVLNKLNSKDMTEAGPINEFEIEEYNLQDDVDEFGIPQPHRPGDIMRKANKEVRANKVIYAQNGKQFGIVTTEGLLIYSCDSEERFLPLNLGIEVTRGNTVKALVEEEYTRAMILALQLGEEDLQRDVIIRVPDSEVSGTVQQISGAELLRLIKLLSKEAERSQELGLILAWVKEICKYHSKSLKAVTEIRSLLRSLAKKYQEISWMCRENTYTLQYLSR